MVRGTRTTIRTYELRDMSILKPFQQRERTQGIKGRHYGPDQVHIEEDESLRGPTRCMFLAHQYGKNILYVARKAVLGGIIPSTLPNAPIESVFTTSAPQLGDSYVLLHGGFGALQMYTGCSCFFSEMRAMTIQLESIQHDIFHI